MFDPGLLEVIACPWCVSRAESPPAGRLKGELAPIGSRENPVALCCRQCGRKYKVEAGIPNLLIEEAEVDENAETILFQNPEDPVVGAETEVQKPKPDR
jgi:uncharacterized protein YbaR (Trm112 family)